MGVLLSLLGAALAASEHQAFLGFAKDFGKSYKSLEDYTHRRAIFDYNYKKMVEHNKRKKLAPAPRNFDWISQGKVSSVKNQAQCGSCAAFSVIGAVESCFNIQNGDAVDDLSEQHILDCAYNHY